MIRTRLTFWNAIVLVLVLTVLGFVAFLSTRARLYGVVDEELNRRADFLAEHWKDLPKVPPNEPHDTVQPAFSIPPAQFRQMEFESYIARPRVIWAGHPPSERELEPWDAARMARALKGSREVVDTEIEGRRTRLLSIPLKVDGKVTGAAQFAASLQNADAGVAQLGRVLLILLPITLVVTALTGVWLTRRALRPVAEIAAAASRIESSSLSERLSVEGNDEFAGLSRVFNAMLDRLENSFKNLEGLYEAQRRFVADASHELKTPLTAIRTRLGVARRKEQTVERYSEHLDAIGRSVSVMSSIVSDLLLLARADEGKLAENGRVLPLDSLLEEAASVVSDAYGIEIKRDVTEGLAIKGDEFGLSRAIVNLLDNAARYGESSEPVQISAYEENNVILLKVSDQGKGIPAEDLPHVFDRFYRVTAARDRKSGGTGLGLAIVRSIAIAHGGSARIDSELGKGTTVTLELPLN